MDWIWDVPNPVQPDLFEALDENIKEASASSSKQWQATFLLQWFKETQEEKFVSEYYTF